MEIKIELSAEDALALEHDLVDLQDWMKKAVDAKIAACRIRMSEDAKKTLIADPSVESMPACVFKLCSTLKARPSYRNRRQRDLSARLIKDVREKRLEIERSYGKLGEVLKDPGAKVKAGLVSESVKKLEAELVEKINSCSNDELEKFDICGYPWPEKNSIS